MTTSGAQIPPASTGEFGVMIPVRTWNYPAAYAVYATALAAGSRIIDHATDITVRNQIPEPLDIPDHIGNTGVTFLFAQQFLAAYYGKSLEALTPDEYARMNKRAAIGVGIFAVAANIFAEKIGYGETSTPDALDFVYGCLGGALAYVAKKPRYGSPEIVQLMLQDENEDSSYKQLIYQALERRQELQRQREDQSAPNQPTAVNSPATSASTKPNGGRNKQRAKMQKASRRKNRRS